MLFVIFIIFFGASIAAAAPATTLSPRYYPQGTCQAQCQPIPGACPNRSCDNSTSCGLWTYPLKPVFQEYRKTYCMTSFPKTCDTQLGCSRCVFLQVARNKCTADERCTMAPQQDYVTVQSKAKDDVKDQLCFAADHWLIVPTRGCTGLESKDPKCTGNQGEKFWGAAYDVATQQKGFSGERVHGEKNISSWGMYINSVAWRSQHQLHIKIGMYANKTAVQRSFQQVNRFSQRLSSPTVTSKDDKIYVSVFIPQPKSLELGPKLTSREAHFINTRVKPYNTALKIANAVFPNAPYGILLSRHFVKNTQNVSAVQKGFVVTATFNVDGSDVIVNTPGNTCGGYCTAWE